MVLLNKLCQIREKFHKHVENISVENISVENTLHQKNYKFRFNNQMKTKKTRKEKKVNLSLTKKHHNKKKEKKFPSYTKFMLIW